MNQATNTPPTFESVWAALMETDRQIKESHAKFKQEMAEANAKSDKEMERLHAAIDKVGIEVDNLNRTVGGMQNSNGSFAEEYFYNSFDNGEKEFFGETFDNIAKNVTGLEIGSNAEYDIVLTNVKSVAIIEIKYQMRIGDVAEAVKKAETFRINFPRYENHRIYLGLAALISSKRVEQECVKKGIAVIKQVGDAVVINDDHLKVF